MRFPGVCDGKAILASVIFSFLMLSAGCDGGGTGTSTGSLGAPVGPAAVDISFVADTANGVSTSAMPMAIKDPSYKPASDFGEIRHVYMEIVKVSLIPAEEAEFDGGDMVGDMDDNMGPYDSPRSPDKPGFVTLVPDTPIRIDLVKLERGKRLARILNHFDSVPAGTYNKIRVYYNRVRIVLADNSKVYFHPTAHSHFDIHFVAGKNLVIPETTDTTYPDSWIRMFKVKLDVVGLKIKVVAQGKSWKGAKVILRPQVFAEFLPPVQYSVAGVVTRVFDGNTPARGDFDISVADGTDYVVTFYDGATSWAYSDNVPARSTWVVSVDNSIAFAALRKRAIVESVGRFLTGTTDFMAREITITFPDVLSGEVDEGWSSDNTFFVLRLPVDNVVVPQPDRLTVYYDNLASPHDALDYTYVDNNVSVKARGYLDQDMQQLEAYWISVAPGP